jgi:predicted ferric reductase
MALEGPYGSHTSIHHYDTAVLIAGGIGVTATYAYASDLVKRDTKQRLIFIWIISSEAPLQWFADELAYLANSKKVELKIHISNSPGTSPLSGSSASSLNEKPIGGATSRAVHDTSHISRVYGRPNVRQIVREEMLDSPGTSAFVVCGPGSLSDDVRISISENLCEAKGRTDYFEEAFSW